jgi:hypothetical protein
VSSYETPDVARRDRAASNPGDRHDLQIEGSARLAGTSAAGEKLTVHHGCVLVERIDAFTEAVGQQLLPQPQ